MIIERIEILKITYLLILPKHQMTMFNFLHKLKNTTLNQLLKNLFNFLLLISIILCVMYCLLRVLNYLNPAVVYAEELIGNSSTVVRLEDHISSEHLARFSKNPVGRTAERYDLGISLTNKNVAERTESVILSSLLEGYKIDNTMVYTDIDNLILEKGLKPAGQYVGCTKKLVTLVAQYSQDEIFNLHSQLPDPLKKNVDGRQKILIGAQTFVDNILKPHEHVVLEYSGNNNQKVYQVHTVTTHPILSKQFVSLFYGKDLNYNYLHAGNSPFIELDPKELDSYVAKTPKIFYFDEQEIKKYQSHFTNKILKFRDDFNLQHSNLTPEAKVESFQKWLKKHQDIKQILTRFEIIPENINQLAWFDVYTVLNLDKQILDGLIREALTNIPKTKLSNTAQPVFTNIFNILENQKLIPSLYTSNIPTIQFDYTPHKYGLNANTLLAFKSTNYSFLMKTIARAQQLL